MSLIRDPATITKVGRQMMTAGGDITYTKATLYGQDISHLTKDQLESLTSIGNPLMTVPVGISDKSDNGNGTTIVLEATFQNTNLKTDLPYTAVGFFAKKGEDEKLIIVAVANAGAYLAATRPDGVATDALDLKVAIAIGDATNVTAVVDPAASVTPATLNSAISETKQVLTALIDTKASQSNLDQTNAEVAKKADSEAVNSQLATKANTTDIDKQVKTLNDAINTKADKATVDAEISKIDFTPYAKTADVSEQIKAVSDEVATKVGADYSYSKAQLDEKLLALSTDTNGKVSADQVTALIADKADKADVDKLLSAKDDTTDVDAKIKTVTDLANTKASQDSLNKLSQAVDTKADKATVDAQIAGIDFSKIKFRKQYLDSQGQTQDHTWKATKNTDGTYTIDLYNDDWTALKVRDLLAQLPTKADQSNVNSQVQDAKNAATSRADNLQSQITRIDGTTEIGAATDVNTLTGDPKSLRVYKLSNDNNQNTPYWCSDKRGDLVVINYDGNAKTQLWFGVGMGNSQSAGIRYWEGNNFPSWHKLAEDTDINTLQKNIDGANANANGRLPYSGGNMSLRSTINWTGGGINDRTGNLGGLHWEGGTDRVDLFADQDGNDNLDLVIQLGDDNSNSVVIRNASGAWVARIDAGGNIVSPTITTLQNQVNDLINQINYIKANYVEGRTFPASQEAQAEAWENEKPTRLAMIEK